MSAINYKQLTLRLDRCLTAMASRRKEARPLGFYATIYSIPRAELQQWADEFNAGSADLDPLRLIEVKRELGVLVDARPRAEIRAAAAAPSLPANKAAVRGGPGDNGAAWLKAAGAKIARPVTNYLVLVTPALAKAWLTLNAGNRKPSRAKVKRFVFAVRASEWIENGETVKFSKTGRLLDGQSRLQAIIEAGVPAMLEVRFGLPDEAQRSMDCGEARRGTHTLEMMGEKNALTLSPALRLVFQWENGTLGGGGTSGRPSVLENLTVPALLQRHAGLRASAAWALEQGAKLRKLMPFSEAAFVHYVFGRHSAEHRDKFLGELMTPPVATQGSSAVALLRGRLLTDPRPHAGVRIRLIVKAWNHHARRDRIKDLLLTPREGVQPIYGAQEAA